MNEILIRLATSTLLLSVSAVLVCNVSFLGNRKVESTRLAERLKLVSDRPFDQNQQNRDVQSLRDEYGGDGYVFAKIEADNRFLEEPGRLDIVYKVEEGSRYRFGRLNIEIKGEDPHTQNTQITAIFNRLSFKPGDIVDTREIRSSQRRLMNAELFKVKPIKHIEPKIVYSLPGSADKDTSIADQRRTASYRVPGGGAPLPPGEGYLDINVSVEIQEPAAAAPPNNSYGPSDYPQPATPTGFHQQAKLSKRETSA